jgi:hypothetical protein
MAEEGSTAEVARRELEAKREEEEDAAGGGLPPPPPLMSPQQFA